jgi:hypothetical protein
LNQATLIFGAIVAAFIGFVATRQRLGVYRNVVFGGASGGQQSAGGAVTAVPNTSPAAGGTHPTLPYVP